MYRQTNDLIKEPLLLFATIMQWITDNATNFMSEYMDTVRNVCCMWYAVSVRHGQATNNGIRNIGG